MSSCGRMNDDRLMVTGGLDSPDAEPASLESSSGLGRTQFDIQLVGFGFGHLGWLPAAILSGLLERR